MADAVEAASTAVAEESLIEAPAAEAAPATPPPESTGAKPVEGEAKPAADAQADAEESFLDAEDEGKAKAADADAKSDDKQDGGAPEAYQPFEVPEGMQLDQTAVEAATPIFRELGLNQGQAQKIATLYAEMQQKAAAEAMASVQAIRRTWTEATRADPEIGGDNLSKTRANAARALANLGSPEVTSLLKETGLGNHPAVLRLLNRVGASISEDTAIHVNGAPQERKPTRAADIMYGEQ